MDNLLSKPNQADEGAQGARDHKTALEAVCKQVLSVEEELKVTLWFYQVYRNNFTHYFATKSWTKGQKRWCD